uniref:Uncharacterized protein n=1 Tax=Amphimedon queenslandica TaxID=400682 RepID=A0A1X7SFY8_AMPQE
LTRVFFPYNPHKHLNEKIKNTLLDNIKRDTPQEKLDDLLEWTKQIKLIKEHKKKLKKFPIGMVFSLSTIRHHALFWLTIVLNLIVIFSLRAPMKSSNNDQFCSNVLNGTCNSTSPMYFQPIRSPDAPSWYMPVLYILGSIHLLLSIWMAVCYFVKNGKNVHYYSIPFIQSFCYQKKKGLLRRRLLYQIMSKLNQLICCGKISANKPHPKEYFQIIFFSFDPLYRLLFLIFSVAGLAFNGYFYCGCMIYPFIKNSVMSFILRALRKS